MSNGLLSALRFARSWVTPQKSFLEASEVEIPLLSGEKIPATLVEAPAPLRPQRGWVVLHGMTRRGRGHSELLRFQRALAATGGRVLVPEIREWRNLQFAPERAQEILRASVEWLHGERTTAEGGVMLAGLSFGAPQAIFAASDPHLAGLLRGVVSWGGYSDLGRIFRFALTGEHRWEGELFRQDPDPYVRWVIGANCLPYLGSPGEEVARALHRLAAAAGDLQAPGSDPRHDPLKALLRGEMSAEGRPLYDLFVPTLGTLPDRDTALHLVEELLPLTRGVMPLLEPLPGISRIEVPIRILHGRTDLLIPFTEALHLERLLAPISLDTTVRLTGYFSHSGEDRSSGLVARGGEGLRLLDAMRGIFELR